MDYRLGPPHPARNFPVCLQTGLYSNTSHKGSTEGGTVAATKSGSCQGLSFLQQTVQHPPPHTSGQVSAYDFSTHPGAAYTRHGAIQPTKSASYDQLLTELCLPVIMAICAFRLVPLNKTPVAVEQSWGESFREQKFKAKSRALCR